VLLAVSGVPLWIEADLPSCSSTHPSRCMVVTWILTLSVPLLAPDAEEARGRDPANPQVEMGRKAHILSPRSRLPDPSGELAAMDSEEVGG